MMSPLSVGEHREDVRAWSEGYRTIEGGGWDHGKMMMMMMVVVMKEMKLKHVMVKMMISLKWNQQIKFGTLQVNYIEDRSVHLAPAQRRDILEVPICLQMLSLKLNWFILSVPSIHVATPSTHSLVKPAQPHWLTDQETWGFCCNCPACSEDKDEPVRLLLLQLQPRLDGCWKNIDDDKDEQCNWFYLFKIM